MFETSNEPFLHRVCHTWDHCCVFQKLVSFCQNLERTFKHHKCAFKYSWGKVCHCPDANAFASGWEICAKQMSHPRAPALVSGQWHTLPLQLAHLSWAKDTCQTNTAPNIQDIGTPCRPRRYKRRRVKRMSCFAALIEGLKDDKSSTKTLQTKVANRHATVLFILYPSIWECIPIYWGTPIYGDALPYTGVP
jgi:hypothetical protein